MADSPVSDEVLRWDLHGVVIEGRTSDEDLRRQWRDTLVSCARATGPPTVRIRLETAPGVPPRPEWPTEPQFRQGDLLEYFVNESSVFARFPRFGALEIDLERQTTQGTLVSGAWQAHGVLEDVLAVSLSPHLRRRGLFLVHAFGAVLEERAALLVGDRGSGKTTTGLALLDAGWKLLSNDSPAIGLGGEVLRYPGLVAAFPDSLQRFASTAGFIPPVRTREKVSLDAGAIWPDVWCDRAPAGAILFPRIASGPGHAVRPLEPADALRRLLPHAIEQWDRPMISTHLRVLRQLVETAPAFELRLGPDVSSVADVIAGALRRRV